MKSLAERRVEAVKVRAEKAADAERKRIASSTLRELAIEYIELRCQTKPNARRNWEQRLSPLVGHLRDHASIGRELRYSQKEGRGYYVAAPNHPPKRDLALTAHSWGRPTTFKKGHAAKAKWGSLKSSEFGVVQARAFVRSIDDLAASTQTAIRNHVAAMLEWAGVDPESIEAIRMP